MAVVPPRQVAILSIANYSTICNEVSAQAADEAMEDLRQMAIGCGVDSGYMRLFQNNTILLRLDDLPRQGFLDAIHCLGARARSLETPGTKHIKPVVRVGAMSERALRSFVNDAAADLLSYMNHVDCPAAFLAGDELDIWQQFESSGIELMSHEQLKYMDPFTGLLRPERFFELLQGSIDEDDQRTKDIHVLYFDIDDFKSYNRAFSYDAGDELLMFLARQIAEAFPSDVVSHLSIDRFAVLTSASDIVRKCAIVHETVRSFNKAFAPEVKCGAFKLEPGLESAHLAMDCAKLACESIKGRYDIACRFFDDKLRERMFTRRYVAHHAEKAVSEHWIQAFAQPVVYTRTGDVCGFEALARWIDPEIGMLSPAVFIPTLEEAHLIHKLDLCIVDEVCQHLAKRMQAGETRLHASVNLSRLDFGLCDAVQEISTRCDNLGIPHSMLAIEVTESALDSDLNLRREMDRFRTAGFEVWMDDFGCGYSSLNLLKDYEFDVLKVDMEFLRDMESNRRSKTIVASVIRMAKRLGIRTLVEGVETKEQCDFLREAGCDMMQGYLFGKPRPLEIAAI
ncbi:MAG: GGDEF domain-containing phosphodiesterase [Coriobacteriales bacterium]|nr:GGDEF domain-containing phosphodiesterase [Coriobacteriales bacterium]